MARMDDFLRDNEESDYEIKQQRHKRLREFQQKKRKKEIKKEQSLNSLDRFKNAFGEAMGEGREIHREAFQDARKVRGQDIEAPRISQNIGTNPTFTRIRDTLHGVPILGSNDSDYQSRIDKGLGLKNTLEGRVGQALGTLGNDIVQDRTRGLWWLLNAPQAVSSVTQEYLLSKTAPELYQSDFVVTGDEFNKPGSYQGSSGYHIPVPDSMDDEEGIKYLIDNGYASLSPDNQLRFKGDFSKRTKADGSSFVTRKRYGAGKVDYLLAPTAVGINAGIGLLNPFGGNEGYEAVLPSYDDPTKTSNVIGEVAAKYILGRTGGMLNWNEFKEARPDVSKDEYHRYKAFKWDKGADLNPFDDGQFTIPTGVLKGTMDGIHGPEIQFLGRSLPIATTIMPTAVAAIGTALGAGYSPGEAEDGTPLKDLQYKTDDVVDPITGKKSPANLKGKKRFMTGAEKLKYQKINRIRNGMIGGFSALAGSSVIGNIIEGERRRRNAVENELKSGNAEQYLGN